jgi:hypothetical protein
MRLPINALTSTTAAATRMATSIYVEYPLNRPVTELADRTADTFSPFSYP